MKVCVVGSGYVGLVVGGCLSGSGNRVRCTDLDENKVASLNDGVIPIYEPGLTEIVKKNLAAGRLTFSTDVADGVRQSEIVFIAVGTPPDEDGSADLSHVEAVARTIAENLNDFKVVVVKSTVPVGTCNRVKEIIAANSDKSFAVVSNPEFLKEGNAVQDFLRPDRIIVGTDNERARKLMSQVYEPFNRTSNRIIFMDVKSSEMTKYSANAMLATRISFMNEVARLCDEVGADVEMVRRGIGSDPRIGGKFIFPGIGFGGSCFPKDLRALVQTGKDYGQQMHLLQAVIDTNDRQKSSLVDRFVEHFNGEVNGLTVALWGIAFKPRTDDLREAPSLVTIDKLLKLGVRVRATDPIAIPNAKELLGDTIEFVANEYDVLEQCDSLMILTEWNAYQQPDFDRIKSLLKQPVILDGRNLYAPARMAELGFDYYSIGRPFFPTS